ncbi:MAG: glycosyltransferase [Solirubrobacterales bacterium]
MTAARNERLRIVVSGMIAAVPNHGGATWAVLQYLLGFARLGHDVTFVEQLDPAGAQLERSPNAVYMRDVAERFGLGDRWALLEAGTHRTAGLPYEGLRAAARDADLLVNISGVLADEDLIRSVPVRVYLDIDPAFNQLWHASGIDMRFGGHTHFVTVGQAIGSPDCPVPTCGLDWIPTLPPVVLEHWPRAHDGAGAGAGAFTTVGNWRGYGSVEHQGQHYGQKAHSMRELMSVPTRTDAVLRPALDVHPGETPDLEALEHNGWQLLDPAAVSHDPDSYRAFVAGSLAEFGVAKSGYVLSRCGWFSDRSACYLASGRPVLAQDTAFPRYLPTGEGLLAFAGVDDALAGIEEIRSGYERHAGAARALAETHLDSDRVLTSLVDRVGGAG